MLENYLKIAVRSLLKRKFYSVINIAGLAVGMTFAGLIGSYVWGEFQVNRSLRHAGQQCLVQSRWKQENMGLPITTLAPVGPALRASYPDLVANFYRYYGINATVSAGNNPFRESIQIGDSTLLGMFGFTLLHGNPRTALTGPNSIVVTAEKALKFFGRTDVLNQTLMVETTGAGKQPFLITGVLRSVAPNSVSQLQAGPTANELFMPVSSVRYFGGEAAMQSWQNQYIVTYVELQPGVTPPDLEKPLARLMAQHTPPELHKNLTAYVTPLTDYYLQSNNGLVWKMIVTLTAVALFILLMAIVNFVNIALGSSSSRLREIGVRKALGGLRQQLTTQFLCEALALTTVAAGLSVALYSLFRPLFSDVVGKPVPAITDLPGSVGVGLLLLVVVVGLLAGSYPALYLSGYSSIDSLKGSGKVSAGTVGGAGLFRRGLVTVQFIIAIFVFVGALVVSRQITYFFTTDLGFKKEAVLTVSSLPRNWTPAGVLRMQAARDQLARLPGIRSASLSFEIPNGNIGNSGSLYREGRDSTRAVAMKVMTTDEHFARTYELPLRAGRFFHDGQGSYDSTSLVLNEAATKALGYRTPDEAIGQAVRFQSLPQTYHIRGVVRNFHVGALHEAIGPLAIGQVQNQPIYRFFSFRLTPASARRTMAQLEDSWRALFPDAPFDYAFMDQTLETLYRSELQLEKAAYVATGLALLIIVLGVVGLVSLSVARRTKEVGIRKVLGASVPAIIVLFLSEYAWIMLLANAVAWPLAYWVVTGWLADYAYHTPLNWVPFVEVGALLALLTGLLVVVQVTKTALTNPVASLRSE